MARDSKKPAHRVKTLVLLGFFVVALCGFLTESTSPQFTSHAQTVPQPATSNQQPATSNQPPAADSDRGAELFVQKCAGCHTIGKGRLSGPDLNESAAWANADLDRAIKAMETKVGPLPDDQVATLRDLLKSPDVRDRLDAQQQRASKQAAATLEPPSVEIGSRLFSGSQPLANGGMACVACHSTAGRGGTLGPDLSGVHEKLGEAPLASACEKSNYKIMSAAYRNHPVTKQEALHLTAYFSTFTAAEARPAKHTFALAGVAGAALMLGVLGFLYRSRHPGRMRQRLTRRQNDDVD